MLDVKWKIEDVRVFLTSQIKHHTSDMIATLAEHQFVKCVASNGATHFFWRPYRGGNTCSHSEHSS